MVFVMRHRRFLIALLLATALYAVGGQTSPAAGAEAQTQAGKTLLLAVGVCPPYRKGIPTELCRNAVTAITGSFTSSLDIDPADVISLVDEASSGQNVLRTLRDLSGRVRPNDRLLIYLVLHGDAFYLWADHYRPSWQVQQIDAQMPDQSEDILVFWTKDEPTVPALAIAQQDWLPVSALVEAIEEIPGKVALVLDSCSSGLAFRSLHAQAVKREAIDYIATASGSEQASNLNDSTTSPLFGQELASALQLPTVRTFGEAIERARISTVLKATAICSTSTFGAEAYAEMFPSLPVPSARTADGRVSPPLWFCAQVPNVVDYDGQLSRRPLATADP